MKRMGVWAAQTLQADEAGARFFPFRAGRPRVGAGAKAALLALAVLVRRAELARILAIPASREGETRENQEEDTDQPLHIDGLLERVIEISVYPTEKGSTLEARDGRRFPSIFRGLPSHLLLGVTLAWSV